MNLPVILDIVIGLIFIYLSFSLLASEIQAILTTILQWRATHLKKSIEELISGQTYVNNNNLYFILNTFPCFLFINNFDTIYLVA